MREAFVLDPGAFSLLGGLVPAAGIVALLVGGLAFGSASAAATMSVGGIMAGVASRTGAGAKPIGTMTAVSFGIALTTFLGAVTGGTLWLHLLVLAPVAFTAGLLVSLGGWGGTLGTQSLAGMIVFGRFPDSPRGALVLAGYALLGGLVQVVLAAVLRWPPAVSSQRLTLAAAYDALSRLASSGPEGSGIPAGQALDGVARQLGGSLRLGTADALDSMKSLLDVGRRIRLELIILDGLRRRLASSGAVEPLGSLDRLFDHSAFVLGALGAALLHRGELGLPALEEALGALEDSVRREGVPPSDPTGDKALLGAVLEHARALAGQLRAAASVVEARPSRSNGRRVGVVPGAALDGTRAQFEVLAANLTPSSEAFRHAVRLALVVVAATLIASHTALGRGYWIALTAAVVLRPDFSATYTRGIARVVGTLAGVAVASLLAAIAHPTGWELLGLIGAFAWAALAVFMSQYALFTALLSALVVFLVSLVTPSTYTIAGERLVDTVIGGALALVVYAIWPTWSRTAARQALHELIASLAAYGGAVLGAVADGREVAPDLLAGLARRARLARSNAEATISRSLTEPEARRIDAEVSTSALAAMRRVSVAIHTIRTDVEHGLLPRPLPAAEPLARGFAAASDALLRAVDQLGTASENAAPTPAVPAGFPALRALHDSLSSEIERLEGTALLLVETDDIVDALDTFASVVGLHSPSRAS